VDALANAPIHEREPLFTATVVSRRASAISARMSANSSLREQTPVRTHSLSLFLRRFLHQISSPRTNQLFFHKNPRAHCPTENLQRPWKLHESGDAKHLSPPGHNSLDMRTVGSLCPEPLLRPHPKRDDRSNQQDRNAAEKRKSPVPCRVDHVSEHHWRNDGGERRTDIHEAAGGA
jgi:hypothetical protein